MRLYFLILFTLSIPAGLKAQTTTEPAAWEFSEGGRKLENGSWHYSGLRSKGAKIYDFIKKNAGRYFRHNCNCLL